MTHPLVEVRAACPACLSTNTHWETRRGHLVYRVCQEPNCGERFWVELMSAADLEAVVKKPAA